MRHRVLNTWFMLLLVLPACVSFVIDNGNSTVNTENRSFAEKPRFTLSTITGYPRAFEAYYNDYLPMKNTLVSTYSKIDSKLFNKSISSKVIFGSDDWLFYNNPQDGNSIWTYKRMEAYSDSQLEEIYNRLISIKAALFAKGVDFILFIAPNKEEVFDEKMPNYILRGSAPNKAEQLVQYVQSRGGIKVVFPQKALIEVKREWTPYFRHDTHWNALGAFIGASALLNAMGVKTKSLDQVSIVPKEVQTGDLLNMGKIVNFRPDIDYTISNYSLNEAECIEDDFYGTYRYRTGVIEGRKILVIRDSFSTAMMPFVSSEFKESVWIHHASYDESYIDKYQPDILVLQYVERSIDLLLSIKVI